MKNSLKMANSPVSNIKLIENNLADFIVANQVALSEGKELLQRITDQQYTAGSKPAFQSTIGAHFRHVLEHYQCFIGACQETESIKVCYHSRPRFDLIEQNRLYALEVISALLDQLQAMKVQRMKDRVCIASDQDSLPCVESRISRELLFLQSHTIHHYAIIAAMCRLNSIEVAEDFGVAISTQAFLAEQEGETAEVTK